MRLVVFWVARVVLFFIARWAVRLSRIKKPEQESIQRTKEPEQGSIQRAKEQFGRLKRLITKLFTIAIVCVVGVLTIYAGRHFSLSDTEREELYRKVAERKEADAIKEQASEENKRQMAREKQEDARWTAQMQKESTAAKPVMSVGAGSCYQRGVSYYRGIGSYPYLNSFPNKGRPADELINQMCSRNPSAFSG